MEFNITTSMSQVRDAVTDTELLKVISPVLADVERNFINLQDAKKTVDTESKGRKLEIRDTLKPQIVTLEDAKLDLEKQIETLKEDNSSETLKEENESLLGFKNTVLAKRRTTFIDRFAKIAEHNKFEKVVGEFKLPEYETKKDEIFDYSKLDFSKMSEEDMDLNVTTVERLDRIEYFGETEKTVDTDGKTTKKTTTDSFKTKVKEAKTLEEVHALQEAQD